MEVDSPSTAGILIPEPDIELAQQLFCIPSVCTIIPQNFSAVSWIVLDNNPKNFLRGMYIAIRPIIGN